MKQADSIAIVSGGLDSTTLVYHMLTEGYTPHLLSFDYGQRHSRELIFAKATAKQLDLPHDTVDLTGLTHLISNSALTAGRVTFDPNDPDFEIEVPEGHYAEENMKATVVPNRNMIMLSIACGVAVNNKYRTVATGVHGGDHFIYPDCRPEFIFSMGQAMLQGNAGFHNFVTSDKVVEVGGQRFRGTALPIFTPFLQATKADIAYRALQLGVPLHLTWSCYKGGMNHCGRCGTCVERLEAIEEATHRFLETQGLVHTGARTSFDQTVYDDTEFWRTAVRAS